MCDTVILMAALNYVPVSRRDAACVAADRAERLARGGRAPQRLSATAAAAAAEALHGLGVDLSAVAARGKVVGFRRPSA